jgi:endonuclease/exonuclease/phosphatase (EEP) superfamily protein YafD
MPFRFIRRSIFPAIAMAWLAGLALGDRPPPLMWLYLIPAPLVGALGLIEGLLRMRRSSRARNVAVFGFTALALIKVFAVDSRWHRPTPLPSGALRVVHWNVAYANFGFVPLLETLAPYRPDLVILSEARPSQDIAYFSNRDLGLPHTRQADGMALLFRYPFVPLGPIPIADGSAWGARLATPAGELDVVCVDVVSHPAIDRAKALAPLTRWLHERVSDVPLLLIGDFNTPRDSRAFRGIRERLMHAYETAGRGWPYTWPLPIPLFAIDHSWHSPEIAVHRYRLRNAPLSDHRRQIFEISIRPRAADESAARGGDPHDNR